MEKRAPTYPVRLTMANGAATSYVLRSLILLMVLALIAALFFGLIQHFNAFAFDRYEKTTDLNEHAIRPGLNIDNLPAVKIDYGKYRPGENVGEENRQDKEDDNNGISDVSPSQQTIPVKRQICLTKGYYLGTKNQYINCARFCHVASEDEVQYRYLEKTTHIINGRHAMQAGAWCLPQTAATCNPNTSIVVYSLSGWICLPRSDAFSGEGGNRIAVCNGSLWDNALAKQYDNVIPANLSFNDVYQDKLSDGRYRFTCPPNLYDDIHNKLLVSKYNRLHLLRNGCLEDIPFGKDETKPDQETGQCLCSPPYQLCPKTGKCTSCGPRFDPRHYTSHLLHRPCFSVRDSTSYLSRFAHLTGYPEKTVLLPCGLDDDKNVNNELTRPRCLDSAIQVYKPLLASANTLKHIATVL